jgi:hypothetical protein
LEAQASTQKFGEQVQLPESAICMNLVGVAHAFAGSEASFSRRKNSSSACQSIKKQLGNLKDLAVGR